MDQRRLAKKLGVREFKVVDIPDGACGANYRYGDDYGVFVHELDNRVRQEHTVFHEIFELIQGCLDEVSPAHAISYRHAMDTQREIDADRFSAAVHMPEVSFMRDVIEFGPDLVTLKAKYRRAYSSILIQVARMMGKLKTPFAGLLYEEPSRGTKFQEEESRTPGQGQLALSRIRMLYRRTVLAMSDRNNPVLASHLPMKGESLLDGTIARLAFLYGEPVLIERATGFDFFGLEDLAVLARPLQFHGARPSKVAIIAVRYDMRALLQPQLADTSFRAFSRMWGLQIPAVPVSEQLEFRLANQKRLPGIQSAF